MQNNAGMSQSYALSKNDQQQRVAYFYDPDVGSYYYGNGHPMKPQRIKMTHSLILGYDLYKYMDVYHPHSASIIELLQFHDGDYINLLATATIDNLKNIASKLQKFNLNGSSDCPVFDGLLDFQSSCAGASIDAAIQLNHKACDIAINWSGGLHHAKRAEASGFCYVNDVVLGILELLKYHVRVMYIDIDVHHGDGVEEAFYLSHRVMTVSFHKYGDYFPGTGSIIDVGGGSGKYYTVNVPLNDGITDDMFLYLFKDIVQQCINVFGPEAIVLQCGADSVTGDRLGTFNVTTYGHGACVEYVKSFNIPLMLIGGGGYTIRNVARTWLYETAITINKQDELSNEIPPNEFYYYYSPSYQLHLQPNINLQNKNSYDYCQMLKEKINTHLSNIENVPSVGFTNVPSDFFDIEKNMTEFDYEQIVLEWEGGGLAIDNNIIMPRRLRRKNYRNDFYDNDDNDQKIFKIMNNSTT